MSRHPFPTNTINPYHLTARSHNKDFFPLPMPHMWDVLCKHLYFTRYAFGLRLHSFVLMSNHYHLIASSPNLNLSEAMGWFMRETAREVNRETGKINQLWGSRFYRSEICSEHHYNHVYKYVYRNPVEAEIVKQAEEYEFSSMSGVLGRSQLTLPIEDKLLLNNLSSILQWINMKPKDKYIEYVQRGLKRKVFSLAKVNSRQNPLEIDML